jgi:hypothetical protein
MARKLKAYLTSQGFYDLAIAAPSMKAALEAWGSNINLLHKGFAKDTDDPAIVAATMKHPGAILQEEAVRAKERERRQAAVAKVQVELDKAQREHNSRASALEGERAAPEERSEAEGARLGETERASCGGLYAALAAYRHGGLAIGSVGRHS